MAYWKERGEEAEAKELRAVAAGVSWKRSAGTVCKWRQRLLSCARPKHEWLLQLFQEPERRSRADEYATTMTVFAGTRPDLSLQVLTLQP